MAMPQIANQRFRITFLLLFIIIGFYFFYFFILVNQKQERLVQKGYRVLTQISKNMAEKLENYQGALPNVNDQKALIENYVANDPSLKKLTNYNLSEKAANSIRLKKKKNPSVKTEELLEDHYFQLQNLKINPQNGITNTSGVVAIEDFYVKIEDFMESIKYEDFFADIILSQNDNNKVIYSFAHNKSFYNGLQLDSLLKQKINHVVLTGRDFKIITLPVEIGEESYLLSGLINNRDYAGLANQFSPFAVASVAIILFIFLLSIPLLKLRLLSKYERMSRGDVYLAGLSAIIVISFIALLITSIFCSLILERQQVKKNLGYISKSINQSIQAEIAEIEHLFKTIDDVPFSLNFKKAGINNNEYNNWNELVTINENGFIDNYTTSFYPYFGQVDTLQKSIKSIGLTSRAYFNQLISAPDNQHYLEPIYSYTTGSVEVATSKKSNDKIQLITSPMYSLLDVVLPRNYSYFIIDNNGKVLFHEKEKKILRENFLAETNNDVSLVKAINQQAVQCLRLKYNDTPILCNITPLKWDNYISDYTLVVTYNLQYLQAKSIFTLTTSGSLMLLLLLLLLVVSALLKLNKNKPIFLTNKVFSFHFLLPSQRNFHGYNVLIFLHSLLVIHLVVILLNIVNYQLNELGLNLLLIALQSSFSIYYFLNSVDIGKGLFYKGKFYAETIFIGLVILIIITWNLSALFHTLLLTGVLIYGQFLLKNEDKKNKDYKKVYNRFYRFVYSWIIAIAVLPALILHLHVTHSINYQELKESFYQKYQSIDAQKSNIRKKYRYDEEQKNFKLQKNMVYFENEYWSKDKLKLCRDEIIASGDTLSPILYQALNDKIAIKPYYNQLNFNKSKSPNLDAMNAAVNADKLKITKTPLWLLLLIIVSVLFLILLYNSILDFAKKVKPFYPDYKSTFTADDFKNIQKLIVYGLPGTHKDKIVVDLTNGKAKADKINFAQLNQAELEDKLTKIKSKMPATIVLENFDHNHHDDKLNQVRMKYLESLVSVQSKIIITTSIDLQKILDDFFTKWLRTDDLNEKERIRSNMDKLESLLQEFTIKTLSLPEYPQPNEPLNKELNSGKYLSSLQEKITHKMQANYGVANFTQLNRQQKEELIIDIESMSHAYYHALWNECTRLEKYVLFDAAEDGFVNHKNKLVIINLLKKGLLIFDDGLKVMNKSFQHFILTGISGTEVIQMEEEARKRGRWSRYSLIIAVLVISLVVFYILAEQEVVNKFTALLTGMIALVPSLFSAARSAISGSGSQSSAS